MKNKLISKNPVLRFQQGKKIVKALLGTIIDYTTRYLNPLGSVAAAYDIIRSNDNIGNTIRKPVRNLYYGYDPDKYAINEGVRRTSAVANKKRTTTIVNKRLTDSQRRLATIKDTSQLPSNWYIENGAVYLRNSDGTKTLIGTPSFHTNLAVNNGTPPARNGRRNTPTTTTTPAVGNTPTYYATRAYRNRIPVSGLNSREAVRKFLQRIGMTGKLLDGIWGDRTLAAYERWKNGLINNEAEENAILNTPTTAPAPTSTAVNLTEITPLMLGADTPTYSPNAPINSPSINNWIAKAKGLKDLKYTLNPIFTTQTLSAKKGGQLISKNPIERFLLGKKLPTAPKAEDRYRNGRRTWNTPFYKEVSSASNIFGDPLASRIAMEVSNNGNDTTFYETPGRWLPVNVRTRTASKKNQNFRTILGPRLSTEESKTIIIDPEYETLKRRFNTAWNLAK